MLGRRLVIDEALTQDNHPKTWANFIGTQMPEGHLIALRTSMPIGITCSSNGIRDVISVERGILYSQVAALSIFQFPGVFILVFTHRQSKH